MGPYLTLSIIRYGPSGVIQGKKLRHPLQLGVVAIERGAFGSPSTTVGQLTIYIYIYIYIYIVVLGSHWSKKSSTADMTSSYEIFGPPSYTRKINVRLLGFVWFMEYQLLSVIYCQILFSHAY